MAKRGMCRCGTIISFELTSQGYKARCPVCKSIVRLRTDTATPATRPHRSTREAPTTAMPSHASAAPAPFTSPPAESPETVSTTPPDFSILEAQQSSGPLALPEIEVFHEPKSRLANSSSWYWWLLSLAGIAFLMLGVLVLLLLWS